MGKLSIVKEIFEFLKTRKKWWVVLVIFFLLVLGALITLTSSSAIAPFIYTIF